jgi:hypothetical protein
MNAMKQTQGALPHELHSAEPESTRTGLPRLIYLAGVPRSGSTVLGRMLGDIPGAIFTGELNLFWSRLADGELCSCGQPLHKCRFWSAVISEGFGKLGPEDARNLERLERTLRLRQKIRLPLLARRKSAESGQFRAAADARMQLYRSIAEVAHVSWIVDSGKDCWFGMLFSCLYENNFDTVHIVRDPRGVAFSKTKTVKSESESRYLPRRPPVMAAYTWLVENLVIQIALKRQSASYVRIRYEDLAADPEAAIREVTHSTKIRVGQEAHGKSGEHEYVFHWVAGNPGVRQAGNSQLQIRLDEEWRYRLPLLQRLLVTVICAPLLPSYGYAFRATRRMGVARGWQGHLRSPSRPRRRGLS